MGRELLLEKTELVGELEILGEGIENSKRRVRVLKAGAAYGIYREMAHYGAVKAVLGLMETGEIENVGELAGQLGEGRERQWVNLGGQLVAGADLARLKQKIVTGHINSWTAVHEEYDALWAQYPLARGRHALAALLALHGVKAAELDAGRWADWLRQAATVQEKIARLTLESRAKDHTNPFRQITFESREEMNAVMGTIEENAFIRQAREEADAFGRQVAAHLERLSPAGAGRKS